jgi:transposase
VDDWIAIRELARQGVSVSEIARRTSHDRKTVRKVLGAAEPKVVRTVTMPRASKLDPYRAYLLGRIEQGCVNGAVLLDEVARQGFTGKRTILDDFIQPYRLELRRKREATERFETAPGKQAQVDWGSFGVIWDHETERWRKLHAFLFTLAYSRAHYLEFATSLDMEHFLACHLHAFDALGIPDEIWYDNLKTGIVGRRPDGSPILPGRFADFALYYGYTPKYCRPYRARTKGKVERSVGYVRSNFWVRVAPDVADGRLGLAGLNERGWAWTAEVAHQRIHGTHGEVVAERLRQERPRLASLDARPRYAIAYHSVRRIGRDGRLSYRGVLYQLSLAHALTEVRVDETLAGEITIRTFDGRQLHAHPVDGPARPRLDLDRYLSEPARSLQLVAPEPVVELRDLAVYEEVARAAAGG